MPPSSRRGRRRAIDGNEAVLVEGKGNSLETRFWLFAAGVALVLVLTRMFDCSLVPPEYGGICITRPFCGLHSSHEANHAWAGRSHIRYGLGYTTGYATLVVGGSPPMLPLYCVSRPPLESWISALGMVLFGMQEWSVRVFDLVLSIACLVVVLSVLRKLYGSEHALLSGLLLVLMPLSGDFGFDPLMLVLALWAFYRYLQLTGRLTGGPGVRPRHLVELAIALFLLVQLHWVGIFYALAIGLHYALNGIVRRQLQWKILAVLTIAPLSSLAVNFQVMAHGLRHNLAVEAPYGSDQSSVGGEEDSAWKLVKSISGWGVDEGRRDTFSWPAWLGWHVAQAQASFTIPILVFSGLYLLYLLSTPVRVLARRLRLARQDNPKTNSIKSSRAPSYLWFFLLPGLAFLLAFKHPSQEGESVQSPLALFLAISAASTILAVSDIFGRIHLWFGRSVAAALILACVAFCNQGLAEYRAVRSQSPRTLALFKRLNKEIPPDKGLLTFKDFVIPRGVGRPATYQPEFAWYLDREMVPANAWRYKPSQWALSVRIDEVADETAKEVQAQAQTGLFWYYIIPAREEYRHDPQAEELQKPGVGQFLPNGGTMGSVTRSIESSLGQPWEKKPTGVALLSQEELDQRLNDNDYADDEVLYWEKHRRYREAVIAELKTLYRYEYYDNTSRPGDENFCYSGITPCYLFDLLSPR